MKSEILDTAIENLSHIPDMLVEVVTTEQAEATTVPFDGELKFLYGHRTMRLPFAIKRNVTIAQLPQIKDHFAKGGVVILASAGKSLKAQLRKLNINYIEASGNAYLAQPNLYVFVDTNKSIKLGEVTTSAAFSRTGLKVIYHLLGNNDAIDFSYRELGEVSGVSIDTVGRIYRELVRDKYLVKLDDRKHTIIDRDRLFKDWVTLFNKVLRPKLKKRSFRFIGAKKLHSLLKAEFDAQLGGELAAEQLTNHNIAKQANIYLEGSFVDLAMRLKLRPDNNGEITMIEQFWRTTAKPREKLVALPLLYADLVANPTPRNLATAKLIFDEYVGQPV